MSPFIIEAAAVGLKEGIKLCAVWLVFSSFLGKEKQGLIRLFYYGLLASSAFAVFSFFIPPDIFIKELTSKAIGFVFFVFFISTVGAVYQSTGLDLFGPLRVLFRHEKVLRALIVFSTVLYFLPDVMGSSMFIREISEMKGVYLTTYISAAGGFLIPVVFTVAAMKSSKTSLIAGFFGIPQVLLFLSMVKLLGGGIKGFAEMSLIPSVERGVMKFVHDVVHQVFVFLMVPDHPLLRTTTWNFIGFFFGSSFAIALVLGILLLPPAIFLKRGFFMPIPEPLGHMTGAERRARKAALRAERRKRAVPSAVFITVVLLSWFSGRGEVASVLYNPKPVPVVEDKGSIVIPLSDPTMNLMDGRLHKFSFVSGEHSIKIIVIKKPDWRLAVCLDACEICPPEGYGQTEGNVVCIYCMTPIPVETLGKPGGCNPVPLKAEVTEKDVRIDVVEILNKWQDVISGQTKEAVK